MDSRINNGDLFFSLRFSKHFEFFVNVNKYRVKCSQSLHTHVSYSVCIFSTIYARMYNNLDL